MDKRDVQARREQQKAIDGILFGADRPVRPRRQPVSSDVRAQARPSQAVATKTIAPKTKLQRLRNEDEEMPDVDPLDLTIDEAKRQKKKFNPRILLHPKQWNWRTIRKRGLIGFGGFLALVLIVGGILFAKGYIKLHKVLKGGGHAVALNEAKPIDVNTEGDGRINILLMGIGGGTHDAPDLTDTILIASIDPVNNKMALLSVPRDLYVQTSKNGSMKINAVYETGKYAYLGHQDSSNNNQQAVKAGFSSLDSMVQNVSGLHINYNALVNFKGFQQAIDTVGGVTFTVPETVYDPTMAWENRGSPYIARAGQATFDGFHALMYVRSRETSSDFARSQRQRLVMVALMQKVFTLGTLSNPQKISSLLDALGNNVVTDISITDLTHMYSITKKIPEADVQSVDFSTKPNQYITTGMIRGQSVVYPLAGLNNYDAIRSYVRNTIKDGYMAKENARVMVVNGSSDPQLATTKANILKSYGYNVTSVVDTASKQYETTTVVDLTKNKKPYTAQYLKHRFNVKNTVSKVPDSSLQTQNADFVIIVGNDETTNSQN